MNAKLQKITDFKEVDMASFSKKAFEEAQDVLKKIKDFDPEFGDQELMKTFEEQVKKVQDLYERINKLRAELTAAVNDKNSSGRELMKTLRKVRDAVGVQYGYDSNEYELVGRTRTSERHHPGPHPSNSND